jgi:hypothetical protein
MRFDRDGFPIPAEFERPRDDLDGFGPLPRRDNGRDNGRSDGGIAPALPGGAEAQPGNDLRRPIRGPGDPFADRGFPQARPAARPLFGKRLFLLGVVGAVLLPAVIIPEAMPMVREMVVEWSLQEAAGREARGDLPGALDHVERAVEWHADDAGLFVRLGNLRLLNGDAGGALRDADKAVALAPMAPQARRLRALVYTVLERPEEALADAEAVVGMAVPGDPESLNFRAYTRALLGRDLPEALADIEQAIERGGKDSPEHLDTRGFILHLLGRHHEAIDDLNAAIDGMQVMRDGLEFGRWRIDPIEHGLRLRFANQGLAVMHKHRGDACAAAGFAGQAKQDLELAERLGFDPSRGVF